MAAGKPPRGLPVSQAGLMVDQEVCVANPKLKLACWDYDRTRPLLDGRVRLEGIDLEISIMRPREAFRRMLEKEEFDVAEVSLASYARLRAAGDQRFVGLPVALSRMFRHSCIYVRADAGIANPQDLRGRRIGVAQLDSTGAIFIKGLLAHEYGVGADEMRWVCGGLESPQAIERPSRGHGEVEALAMTKSLCEAFADHQIDALISNHIPSLFTRRDSKMVRLFPDFKAVEQHYFQRTGIFPIMHIVALRAEHHRREPKLAAAIYDAFCRARDIAIGGIYDTDALRLTLPWLIDHVEEAQRVLGENYWVYGVEGNRNVWNTFCRYLTEQGFTRRSVSVDELFVVG
jgi:4,5-dihydroxyphthalate decarboxylase